MPASASLGELLSTILERRPFGRVEDDSRAIEDLCQSLLSQKNERSGLQVAAAALERYRGLTQDQKLAFFQFLNSRFDLDRQHVVTLASTYAEDPSPRNYAALTEGTESKRPHYNAFQCC